MSTERREYASAWVGRGHYAERLTRSPSGDAVFHDSYGKSTFTYTRCQCDMRPYHEEERVCPFCWVNGRKELGQKVSNSTTNVDVKETKTMDDLTKTLLAAKDEIIKNLKDELERLRADRGTKNDEEDPQAKIIRALEAELDRAREDLSSRDDDLAAARTHINNGLERERKLWTALLRQQRAQSECSTALAVVADAQDEDVDISSLTGTNQAAIDCANAADKFTDAILEDL